MREVAGENILIMRWHKKTNIKKKKSMTEMVLRWRLPPLKVRSLLLSLWKRRTLGPSQHLPPGCSCDFHQAVVEVWSFSSRVLREQSLCTHLDHSPQRGKRCGQEAATEEEVLSWWACSVKSRSSESYVSKEPCWHSLHW